MKTASHQNKSAAPAPFQIAVLPEDFVLPSLVMEAAPSSGQTPFADLMLHPEKLEAALKVARRENDAFDASLTIDRSAVNGSGPDASSKRSYGARESSRHLKGELKVIEFYLEAPLAASVRLAADFTDWEKFPLDMIKAADGVWSIFIPLGAGNYSYRFIVDGIWHDDPRADSYEPNPFGAANAVVRVT